MSYEPEHQQMAYAGDEHYESVEEWEEELYYAEAVERWNEDNWDSYEEWETELEQWVDEQLDGSF